MNPEVLNSKIQDFINAHLNDDLNKLILKGSPFIKVSTQELGQQIKSKKKCQHKLPTWYKNPGIYYPKSIHIEQSSSELTGNYKSKLIQGQSLIDITGGFGVDTYFFSKKINNVIQCELNSELSQISSHNFKRLGADNITCHTKNGLEHLQHVGSKMFDVIYVDPSRRNDKKGKVFMLSDCLPNIPENLEILLSKCRTLLIKTAPLLDIAKGIEELKHVKEVHVVAVNNDVKELIFLIEGNWSGSIRIKTVNFNKNQTQKFNFRYGNTPDIKYELPLKYIYEPNHAILKSGGFAVLAKTLKIAKLHPNSHLYTSNERMNFPGRAFELINCLPYKKKVISQQIPHKKANITLRNFPDTVANIRKKTGLRDGGENYLFFTTDKNNRYRVLNCKKVHK